MTKLMVTSATRFEVSPGHQGTISLEFRASGATETITDALKIDVIAGELCTARSVSIPLHAKVLAP